MRLVLYFINSCLACAFKEFINWQLEHNIDLYFTSTKILYSDFPGEATVEKEKMGQIENRIIFITIDLFKAKW